MAPRGTYREIAADLRRRVEDGELTAGELVPSESALAAHHQVSRGTVRAALSVLADEGLLEVVPGQGRRVIGDGSGTTPSAAYARLAAELRRRLDAGEFRGGKPLPSEAALVAEFGVSRNTVRRAYQVLAASGAVVVRHGVGAFPASEPED